MQTTQSTGFSWYTAPSGNTGYPLETRNDSYQNSSYAPPLPASNSNSESTYNTNYNNVNLDAKALTELMNQHPGLTINAQNVYIEEGAHHDQLTQPTMMTQPAKTETKTEVKQNLDNGTTAKKEITTVKTENPTGVPVAPSASKTETTTTTAAPSGHIVKEDTTKTINNNPLGVQAPVALATNNAAVQPSTAPSASTTLKDGVHQTPLSGAPASDKLDTKAPLSTSSNSSTLPADSKHPAEPSKPKKEHKSMKNKFQDWKLKRKGGGKTPGSDVHPKDSRDGKVLPSEEELGKYMNLGNESADEKQGTGLPKDKLDATGKTVTGSDANPSKASNPFRAPVPVMKQAPVEAKAQ